MIGSTISHYKIDEKLGEGGMGVVYKATDNQLDRPVALKFLPPQFTASDEDRTRFIREAKAASSLDHANICKVYEAGQTDDGRMFMAMAYYEGSSLKDVIEKGKMHVEEALNIAMQIAEALHAADAKGIVHRDVKPGNIIITPEGVAKLVDFGLASQEGWAKLTMSHTTLGTAAYMAPEQATGEGADHRSDLWSLGVVLYQMLTGKLPFRGDHEAALLYSIVNEEPEQIEETLPDAPMEMVHVITRLLEKDPDDRYQSAAEVVGEIKRIIHRSGKDTSSTGLSGITRSRYQWKRRLNVIIPAGVSVLAACVAVFYLLSSASTPDLKSYSYTPLVTGGMAGYAKWSPDGRSISYVEAVRESLQLVIYDIGSKQRRVLGGDKAPWIISSSTQPRWSSDGANIYFIWSSLLIEAGMSGTLPLPVRMFPLYSASISYDTSTIAVWTGSRFADSLSGSDYSVFVSSPADFRRGEKLRRYTPDPFTLQGGYRPTILLFSPDGSQIGLSMYNPLGSQLWILPWPDGPGTNPRRILANVPFDRPPEITWLPDSRRILYSYEGDIWICDTEDESTRRITASSGNVEVSDVSEDGKRILLQRSEQQADIWRVPLDGSEPEEVMATSVNEYSATVSSDGSMMVYITEHTGRSEIWAEDQLGNRRPIVTPQDFGLDEGGKFFVASVSPEGTQVAYTWSGGSSLRQLCVSNVEGGKPLPVLPDSTWVYSFSWSPEGKRLYALATEQEDVTKSMVVPIGGGETIDLPDSARSICIAVWSPDGEWIAMGRGRTRTSPAGILLISPDGKRARMMDSPTPPSSGAFVLTWSQDSRTLYITSSHSRGPGLFALDVQTGEARKIGNLDGLPRLGTGWTQSATGSLSRDKKSLLVTTLKTASSIYILDGAL